MPAVIPLPLQNTPKTFHRTIVNALANAGHTLSHTRLFQLRVKDPVCVLEPSVTVEQGMGIGIPCHSLVKGVKNQGVVIGIPDNKGYDAPVIEVQYGTEIDLVFLRANVILELCHIRQPFLVRLLRMKFSLQNIFCKILRIGCLPRTAMATVLDSRFDPSGTTDPQDSLIIHRRFMEPFQIIPDASVSFVWILLVDLLYQFRNTLILCCPRAPMT